MPKKREKTLSFICELPLRVTQQQEVILLTRLEAGRQLYNTCLGETMRRLRLIRQSKDYNAARTLKKNNPQRPILFKRARDRWGFSDYEVQAYATRIRHSWIGEHIDAHTAARRFGGKLPPESSLQKLATRAYLAAEKVMYGAAKSVRFKGKDQLDSLESKSNVAGIRWRNDAMEWSGLRLNAIILNYDPVVVHGLSCRIKYVRLVRRKCHSRNSFYAQLVCQGKAFQKPKNKLGKGDVGLDLGPSTIAIVGNKSARLEQFASELEFLDLQIRSLQRRLDRSRRANNPENYNPDGTINKGKKIWNNSRTYFKTRDAKANLERKLAGHRKSLHGALVHSILSQGDAFKLEKLSYKAFQKLYGRSVGKRAPGMFVTHLKRKAESAGGKVVEFPTYNTKLSQTCQCGRVEKKSLKQRVHKCECGVHAQRDLYSAFLAKYIDPETNVLQVNQVLDAWCSVELLLRAAWRAATTNQPATGRLLPSYERMLPGGRVGRRSSPD